MIELPELEPGDEWRLVFSDRSYNRNQYVEAYVVRHVVRPKRGAVAETIASSLAYLNDEKKNRQLTPDELVDQTVNVAVANAYRSYLVGVAFDRAKVAWQGFENGNAPVRPVAVETEP